MGKLQLNFKALLVSAFSIISLFFISQNASATSDIGAMASSITSTFANIGLMVTGGSYIAGLAFAIGAIMKFKQHKDNPTQIPIGTPISLVFIAGALLFLPSILSVTGQTMFGTAGSTAGPTGVTIS
jgi:intracellular multiplication protein IcmD